MHLPAHTLPVELVRPVLDADVLSRADLRSCALVNHVFHAESIAVLYRNIEAGIIVTRHDKYGQPELVHPCTTILQKPWYANYVHCFSESSDVATIDPMLLIDFLAALRLCTHLRSFTWSFSPDAQTTRQERILIEYLAVLRRLRVPKLDIRGAPAALGAQVLTRLLYMDDLTSIGVQTRGSDVVRAESMAAALRERLTHFELAAREVGSRSYVPLFSRLRGLTSLTLRNITTRDVLEVLAVLPALTVLDTHFLVCAGSEARLPQPACQLQHLTIYVAGPSLRRLWTWIPQLVPRVGLQSLTVRNRGAVDTSVSARNWTVAPTFLRRIARIHGATLENLELDALYMTQGDFSFLCGACTLLERLACGLTECDMDAIGKAICGAQELRQLSVGFKVRLPRGHPTRYAEQWLRQEGSKLASMTLRNDVFQGAWVYRKADDERPAGAYYEISHSETEYNLYR
ncbi:hypothetical protein PsYK624_108770 [Phanerochaete sordida]|uniref:Uncharacterized protein n=1 Tax=Phanerochaete sordida TaxID=48140 RepID=A0A9P3LGM4_9APHY|nr:hypothetical protein PsYK624_108770 [Phanerochaete sordida]